MPQITASVTFLPLLDEPCRSCSTVSESAMAGKQPMLSVATGWCSLMRLCHVHDVYHRTMASLEGYNCPSAAVVLKLVHAGTFDLLVYTDQSSDVPTEWYGCSAGSASKVQACLHACMALQAGAHDMLA